LKKRISYLSLYGANALIYGLNALYYGFLPIFLENRGRSNDEIGYLLAAAQLVSVFAPFFWGMITDKAKYKNNILAFLILCAGVSFTSIILGNSLVYLFVMIPLVMFFQNNFGGLIDTVTIEACDENNWKYGTLRLMGTLGFGLISMVFAPFIEGDNIRLLFIVYPAVCIASIALLMISPKVKGHAEKKEKISLKPLFKDRVMLILFVTLAVSLLCFNYYQNFYAKFMIASVENGGLGIPEWIMGVNTFLTVSGEICFFLLYDKLMEKVGVKKLLWIFVILSVVRYAWLALAKDAVSVLVIALVTGLVPTVITYCATYYMMRIVAPNMRASGQMAMYALCSSLPRVIGSAVGGVVTERIGTPGGLLSCAALSFISLIPLLFLPKDIYQKNK